MLSGKIGEKRKKKKSQMSFVFYFLGGRMKEEKKITQMHIIKSKQNQILNEKNLCACVIERDTIIAEICILMFEWANTRQPNVYTIYAMLLNCTRLKRLEKRINTQ